MEIKLAESPIWKRSAIIWFLFAALQFWGAGYYSSFFSLIAGITAAIVGWRFLTRMPDQTYLTLQDETLTIHLRKISLGKKRIRYSDINKGEVIGKQIILYLKNGRTVPLRNDWLSYDDLSKIKKESILKIISQNGFFTFFN
ncbi:hypothetical protein [Sporosarcina sp. FSL K6-2383]|uniref:hypothetical protein n=1 Tax=Sporosarcina sp. FSL K6-2383 TaxID=2921556 RepID=UPI00315A0751